MNRVNPALVVAMARGWIGTPWCRRGSTIGRGADCVGLVRGLLRDLSGVAVPAPAWHDDWPDGDPIRAALRRYATRGAPASAGAVALFRTGPSRAAHVGILTDRGVIHADDRRGVVEARALPVRPVSVYALPLTGGAVTRADATAFVGVLYGGGMVTLEIYDSESLDLLSRSAPMTRAAAITTAARAGIALESME